MLYLNGVEVNEDTLGFDALAEQGPGEHLFGTHHTMQHYKTAYYDSALDDNQQIRLSWAEPYQFQANGIMQPFSVLFSTAF